MAGIFPQGGTLAGNTKNGADPVQTVEGCIPLFYRDNCVPVFDPVATNALISEVINAVNLVKAYDCSRLDNLADAFKYIGNLCNLPTVAELGIEEITNADTLAGCFSSLSGRISIEDLRTVILDSMLCGLPTVSTAKNTDFLAGCFDVNGTPTEAKISMESLKSVIGSGAPTLTMGARFAVSAGSPIATQINVGNRTRMILRAPFTASHALGYAGRINNFSWLNAHVTNGGNSDELIWYALNGAMGNQFIPAFKVGDGWYAVNNGVATYLVNGTVIPAQGTVEFYEGFPLSIGG